MTSCGFKPLVSDKYQKQASESIIILKCTKDIKGHLMKIEYLRLKLRDPKDKTT